MGIPPVVMRRAQPPSHQERTLSLHPAAFWTTGVAKPNGAHCTENPKPTNSLSLVLKTVPFSLGPKGCMLESLEFSHRPSMGHLSACFLYQLKAPTLIPPHSLSSNCSKGEKKSLELRNFQLSGGSQTHHQKSMGMTPAEMKAWEPWGR